MTFYIDPGTGSMLFAILIGIIGALTYLLKGWFVKLKFLLSGGKATGEAEAKVPLAIYAESRRYYNIFEPILRELDRRGVDVLYLTSSRDDPVFTAGLPHVKAEFIGEGNKAFAKLNFVRASILFSTTPGLDVYQWKRSKDVDRYIHIFHAPNDVTLYRMFGVDYYDTLLISGAYQEEELRSLETLRELPAREIVSVGIPYLDSLAARLRESGPVPEHETTVLIAPSWGPSGILSLYGGKIIQKLLQSGFKVIIRPHPQSFTSEKEMIDRLMEEFPESEKLSWNRDTDNFEVLRSSDLLISDFSGVIFDFTLVYDKPVIYANTDFDSSVYDAWWLEKPLWTFDILPKIGRPLTEENFDSLKDLVETCLKDPSLAAGRDEARRETWEHMGEGAEKVCDLLCEKLGALSPEKAPAEIPENEGSAI